MEITHLATVTIYVTDQQKSLDFYVDQLGFDKRADRDMGPMGRWLEVAPHGARTGFVLARADTFGRQDRVGDSVDLVFESPDVPAVHQRLLALGVPVTEPDTQAWGASIKVTDPDGLTILVKQPR